MSAGSGLALEEIRLQQLAQISQQDLVPLSSVTSFLDRPPGHKQTILDPQSLYDQVRADPATISPITRLIDTMEMLGYKADIAAPRLAPPFNLNLDIPTLT